MTLWKLAQEIGLYIGIAALGLVFLVIPAILSLYEDWVPISRYISNSMVPTFVSRWTIAVSLLVFLRHKTAGWIICLTIVVATVLSAMKDVLASHHKKTMP